MATLTPASAAAIARLRSYMPPPTTWYSLPQSRRAAVLILLFADKAGDLRVVLTMRAATLNSYAGQAALPGGKTDSLQETPLQTARREAMEEIGLPMPASYEQPPLPEGADPSLKVPSSHPHSTKFSPPTPDLPKVFRLEHLCQLPTNLAKTELGVRPCVAFLSANNTTNASAVADVETGLIPRLDAKEVAAVFSGPLHNFLKLKDIESPPKGTEGEWYKGTWIDWHETKFRMHNFYVPIKDRPVSRPRKTSDAKEAAVMTESQTTTEPLANEVGGKVPTGNKHMRASDTLPYREHPKPYDHGNPDPLDTLTRYRVFGMTARILVDCARVAYGEEAEFEHNSHFGDEHIIQRLIDIGRMGQPRKKNDEFVGDDLSKTLSGGFGGVIRAKQDPQEKL